MDSENMVAPVLVFGALRSGTTLLRLMLDRHEELSCPGETDYIFDHLEFTSGEFRYDFEQLEADRIYRDHADIFGDCLKPSLTAKDLIENISDDESQTTVLMSHRNLSKTLDVFPQMRLVHLLRDPRDVARSSIGMGWAGNVYYGVDHWMGTEDEWHTCKPRLSPDQYLEITYENLISEPKETLEKICRFVGLSYRESMLSYDTDSSYKKPDTKLIMQWKRKQSDYEIGLVEAKIADRLISSGYAPSGYPKVFPTRFQKLSLWIQNKRKIWAVRIERYGLRDPLIVAIGRKLGLISIQRSAQRRIDVKTLKYLK